MSARAPLIAVLLAATALASTPAPAQDTADDANAALLERFQRMHGMSDAFAASESPAERHALMQDHMRLMQDAMRDSSGMMGGGMMGQHAEGPHDDMTDMGAMQSQMMMMHQMMMSMMAQQDMMMQMMDGEDEDDDE